MSAARTIRRNRWRAQCVRHGARVRRRNSWLWFTGRLTAEDFLASTQTPPRDAYLGGRVERFRDASAPRRCDVNSAYPKEC